jgi:hypothetical protein
MAWPPTPPQDPQICANFVSLFNGMRDFKKADCTMLTDKCIAGTQTVTYDSDLCDRMSKTIEDFDTVCKKTGKDKPSDYDDVMCKLRAIRACSCDSDNRPPKRKDAQWLIITASAVGAGFVIVMLVYWVHSPRKRPNPLLAAAN